MKIKQPQEEDDAGTFEDLEIPEELLRLTRATDRASEGVDFASVLGPDRRVGLLFLAGLATAFEANDNDPERRRAADLLSEQFGAPPEQAKVMTMIAKSIAIGYMLALNDLGK